MMVGNGSSSSSSANAKGGKAKVKMKYATKAAGILFGLRKGVKKVGGAGNE